MVKRQRTFTLGDVEQMDTNAHREILGHCYEAGMALKLALAGMRKKRALKGYAFISKAHNMIWKGMAAIADSGYEKKVIAEGMKR